MQLKEEGFCNFS